MPVVAEVGNEAGGAHAANDSDAIKAVAAGVANDREAGIKTYPVIQEPLV